MWLDGGPRVAAPTPSSRYFPVDVGREHEDQPFGCKFAEHPEGLIVKELTSEGNDLVTGWNQRSGITFPLDALKPGDVLLKVNAIGIDCPDGVWGMMFELDTAIDLLLLVKRET